MAKLKRKLVMFGLLAAVASGSAVQAQSADALINKLVEKGILNVKEANELREEADKDFNEVYASKTGMPEWVTSLKFSGDLRLRYDGLYADHEGYEGSFFGMPFDIPGIEDRHRGRFRLRYGVTASLLEHFEVGFRLASTPTGEEGDPISTNESFQNNANRKPIAIDLVYVRWTPIDATDWSLSFSAGKFENPFEMSEMLFDSDYTPEGFGEQFTYHFNEQHAANLTLAQFFLDEISGSSRDAFMLGAQARLDSKWTDHLKSSAGLAGLSIINPETLSGLAVPDINFGNSRSPNGVLLHNYDLLVADLGVTYTFDGAPFYRGKFPVTLAGEYVHNFGAPDQNTAFAFGPTFGKAGKQGTWEFSIKYKEMQADAMYEEIVDSDYGAIHHSDPLTSPFFSPRPFYAAGTNVRGPVFRFSYSPYDFLTLSTMYAVTEVIDEIPGTRGGDAQRILVDAVFKF